MHEIRPGFFVPDGISNRWLFRDIKGSVPNYALDRIQACVAACSENRRTAIDGGAYVGSWTMHLAAEFNRVIAYEPVPTNFECLQRNVEYLVHCGKAELYNLALSDSAVPMARRCQNDKPHGQRVRRVSADKAEFMSVTIDSTGVKDVDLIKLDLEGHEFEALCGAEHTIRTFRPAVMIEEKLDPERRASKLLTKWGMVRTWSQKYDFLFTWPSKRGLAMKLSGPSLANVRGHYYDDVATTYDRQRSTRAKWRLEHECLSTMLEGLHGSRVLDVPVGTGRFLQLYKDLGLDAVGVDCSDAMLNQARFKHPDAVLEIGDAAKLHYPDGAFDTVVCVRLLHLIAPAEVPMVMGELFRVAKSNVIVSINFGTVARPVKRSQIHVAPTLLASVPKRWKLEASTCLLPHDGKLGSYHMWRFRRANAVA